MPNVNFKLSDNKKCQMLWELLNTQFNEEGNWTVGYDICEVYDDYAVVHNFYENQFERVYYKKDDESDSLEITARKRCYIIDVTEDEKKALDAIHNLNNSSFEKIDELYTNLQAENSENGTKLEECNASIATLTTERDNALEQLTAANAKLDELTEQYTAVNAQVEELNAQYTASQNDVATISAERDALATYKKEVELAEKKRIIGNYTEQLNADVIDEFTAKIDDMSAEELDMKLTYMVKKTHPEIFSNQPAVMYVPKDVPRAGIETILDKYEKH